MPSRNEPSTLVNWVRGALLVLGMLVVSPAVHAHDAEQWIANKQLTDPVSKQFCCGPIDCNALEEGKVQEVEGGYSVSIDAWYGYSGFTEFVPYNRAMPFAPDGRFHACITRDQKSKIRYFIVPPNGS